MEKAVEDRIALEVFGPAQEPEVFSVPPIETGQARSDEIQPLPAIDAPLLRALEDDAGQDTADGPVAGAQSSPAPADAPENRQAKATDSADPDLRLREVEVKRGDSLSTIFSRVGLGYREVHEVMALGDPVRRLERIRPGEKMTFRLSPESEFLGLSFEIDRTVTLDIRRDGSDLVAREVEHEIQIRQAYHEATINSSLYMAAMSAGMTPDLVLELAEIFGWKIDFLRDVREGDQFRMLYETRHRDGKQIGVGNILAAEFINEGETHQAVRYVSPEGRAAYYSPDGESLERGFLRYPVEFSRISSRFSMNRLHPVHKVRRAHKGVDLAAPTGTPIRAASGGKVHFVGWQNGYGKVIYIEHDQRITTVYGHLSRFNNRLKKGSTVSQGDVIGYVGMTGTATGPHLHYEFRVNGEHKDPLKVELPESTPIPSEHRRDFLAQTQGVLDQMANLARVHRLAQSDGPVLAEAKRTTE
ncbi:MAG: peptidoglycan DD-metalloendopeptidase family protein [Halothiobacillaceae bacterium]